ncbi:golgin subfamily B member 1-like isoform X2 [Dendronephthya gigantea]|uniref:golgin subfamily B member 1-like isoform X2 n=1 Tax=Dendronephthya gigantea TaxID=151771 RepID=UPI00106C11F7|nr:golgin subfamily B member 1-like isoform X2 [Dendronephthya gigantea]
MDQKPKPKPRTRRYEKSSDHVEINDDTRAALTCNASPRLLPGVGDILQEVKNLKQQLASVKEERDEFKEEVTFLKYQLSYRAQVQNLQQKMNGAKEGKPGDKKTKSVRFAGNIIVNNRTYSEDDTDESIESPLSPYDEAKEEILDSSFDNDEYERLKAQADELEDVLHDFYHDSKLAGKNSSVLIGNVESLPSESISSLVCRALVNYDKLFEEHRILEEEKSKLDEDKIQLTNSMAKLREQLHDAVDSNIEEIEDLNHQNENLRSQVKVFGEKNSEVISSFIKAREDYIGRLKAIKELVKGNSSDKLLQRLKNDALLADIELKEAKEWVQKVEEDKSNRLKRVQSLPSTFRQDSAENTERGGLLKELKTCKNLQESQRKQISKILDEKLVLETHVAELKRQVVLLKAERRINLKTKSKFVQTEGEEETVAMVNGETNSSSSEVESLTRRCKDLEQKLERVKEEKLVLVSEKTSLLLAFDANIEKKDALEEQLAILQEKMNERGKTRELDTNAACTQTDGVVENVGKTMNETDGGFRRSYKGISEAKVELEKIRVQEQEKHIAALKRENEAIKEKLKKAEDMSQTLQNCLKELTDEKLELLDSIEELNEEKAELEEIRSKLEKELSGTKREKFVADEVGNIRNKERKIDDSLESNKAKLAQLDLRVAEVLSLIENEGAGTEETKSAPDKGVEDIIGSLLAAVENLKATVTSFKTSYERTKGDSLRTKNELEARNNQIQALTSEKTELEIQVGKLTKQNEELAQSLENTKKSQKSHDSYMERLKKENSKLEGELGQARGTRTGYEKSLAESRRREEDLARQLKNITTKRDDMQKALDQFAKRSTNETEAIRSENKKLTTEVEQLREELEGTVEDRDELLELLDRIVCENGTGEEKQGLGEKVERIRERSKSEEALAEVGVNDSGRGKIVGEKLLVSSEMSMNYSATGEDSLFEGKEKSEVNVKRMEALQEENQKLKEMIEKMLTDQKKMEHVLNSLSEANAEIQQGLEESLEKTEQIRLQGSKNFVDFVPEFPAISVDNVELRRLHEAMVGTNEALSANLRRLHDEKTRSEQMKTSYQEVNRKNETLEKNVESLTRDKQKTEKEMLELNKKMKNLEAEARKAKNEKDEVESTLAENNGRVKDLQFQIDSLTEINQDLRESNEKLSDSSKEYEKKLSKLNGKFDELEFQNEGLKKSKKRLEKELAEQGKQKTALELNLAEQSKQKTGFEKELTAKDKQKSGLELELADTKKTIVSLRSEISGNAENVRELEKSLEKRERELKVLRETAGQVAKLEQEAQDANALRSDMEDMEKTLSERDHRVEELENDVTRLKKEIQNSQRFVKAVSQENDTLRDSLSEWEREASKIRRHVHQLSQDAENHNSEAQKDPNSKDLDKVRSVKAFEAMQVEMDAINKHLKSLTEENHELHSKLDEIGKENKAIKDRNIELLTRYDILSKQLEKKTSEVNKLSKDGRDSRSKKNNEKFEKEKISLEAKIEKLNLENTLLKKNLANTLDEHKRIGECLKNLLDNKKVQRQNSNRIKKPSDLVSEEYEIRTEISTTTKPDLIRDSTEVKEEYKIVEQRKYRSELSAVEASGTEADIRELLTDLLKGQMNLKSYCQEISKVFKNKSSSIDEIDGVLDATKLELKKTAELNKDLESSLQNKEAELTKINEEKAKMESEVASIKEKCDKLQAVFRALILAMNDKKGAEKKNGEEAEGPTRIIDYIKGIKTKYTTLVTEKEDLETKVKDLQKEINELKARAEREEKQETKSSKNHEASEGKVDSEDKERMFNELLLSTARNKTRLLEKLQEIFDEFSKVKSKLDKELENQEQNSNLEKINQEFSESVMHTERFIQSVAHDRPVTVVADSATDKDPNLELAKENEELVGRISAIQSSRRRESKNFKDEVTKMEKAKVEAVKDEGEKWKEEIEKVKEELEKKMKEKEQAASEVKNSLKQEVSQLKLDMRRMTDEHEVAQRSARNEARLAAEKLEEKIKLTKTEMEKKLAERDTKMVEVKRKADAEAKENAQMAEREISQVRANWADAERKLRNASEEKTNAVRELERVKLERSEEGARSARELQKLKVALDSSQKQISERENGFKMERERLQRTIVNLEGAVRNSEVSGLERTQSRINEFQRSLDELTKQNQQLETARRNSEHTLGSEVERLRLENSRLHRDLREQNQQRRTVGVNEQQRRPDPNIPSGERVKVMGTVRQTSIEKSRVLNAVESAPGPLPGDRRAVKVREGQASSVHVTRVQDQGVRRSSDQRDPVSEELGAMFKNLNNSSEWMNNNRDNTSSVILARPMEGHTQAQPRDAPPPQKQAPQPSQKPQAEWETRPDKTWPMRKDPRYPTSNARPKDPVAPPTRAHPSSQRAGHNNEDSRQRSGYANSKPITRQVQGNLEVEVTSSDARRVVEVKKPRPKDKSHSSKSRRPRRPSVGSDDVFITHHADANPSLTSHGSKTGEFWRSRSLEDLISDDRPMKSGQHGVRGHHEKLPKNFSGPRRGVRVAGAQVQSVGPGNQSVPPKRVTPLKGMENILFQSQI